MKGNYLLFPLLFIMGSCIIACTNVDVGTYKGGKILTSFGPDSLWTEGEMRRFNCDSLFYRIVTEGYTPEVQNVNVRYFVDIVDHMSYEGQLQQIERFREAGRTYNCKQLRDESDFCAIWYYPDTTEILFEEKVQRMDHLIDRMRKEKEVEFEIRCREFISGRYWKRGKYVRPFKEFPIIDKLYEQVSDVNKLGVNASKKKSAYYWFGQCYYLFRDFETAIHYYKKATVEPSELLYAPYHMYDETNLFARIALGRYYREIPDMDTSDFYFHSMLEMSDQVKRREMFDAIAWCNLGVNMQIKKEYAEAIKIMRQYLPVLVQSKRYSLAAETSVSIGEALLASGKLDEVQATIDSAFHYASLAGGDGHISQSYAFAGNTDQLPTLYLLAGKYYALKKDVARSVSCLDSSVYYRKKIDNRYNSMVILRAEQESFDAEKSEMKQRGELAEMRMLYVVAATALILILLAVYIYLYHKKKKAYRALALRIFQWAQGESERTPLYLSAPEVVDVEYESVDTPSSPEEKTTNAVPDAADQALMKSIERLMCEEEIYKDSQLSLDSLALKLGTKRHTVSQAINRCTNEAFHTLVNEYRVKEAVRLLSEKKNSTVSVDTIAFDSGFSDRWNFYRVFKKTTGLSPTEFRKNLNEN